MLNATEQELQRIWDIVFNLSLNFLHDEAAAEEATQDVFLKATEAADSFRGESSLSTWVYRIARNLLVDRTRAGFRDEISFELFERDVSFFKPFENEIGLTEAEMALYVEDIKVGCTKAMLQCLDAEDRFAYIVGKLFGFPGKVGAEICGTTEAAYRQRLSRASRRVTDFVSKHCGRSNANAACQCRLRIGIALERGRVRDRAKARPDEGEAKRASERRIRDYLSAMEELDSVAEIFRDNPFVGTAEFHAAEIRGAVERLAKAVI